MNEDAFKITQSIPQVSFPIETLEYVHNYLKNRSHKGFITTSLTPKESRKFKRNITTANKLGFTRAYSFMKKAGRDFISSNELKSAVHKAMFYTDDRYKVPITKKRYHFDSEHLSFHTYSGKEPGSEEEQVVLAVVTGGDLVIPATTEFERWDQKTFASVDGLLLINEDLIIPTLKTSTKRLTSKEFYYNVLENIESAKKVQPYSWNFLSKPY